MRTVREIYDVLFAFAPERMKMGDWDNVGLLCGRFSTEVETVLVALDPLPDVIAEAVEVGAKCIVTHHPLFLTRRAPSMKRRSRAALFWS